MKKIGAIITGVIIIMVLSTIFRKWLTEPIFAGVPGGGPFYHPKWLCIASSISFLGGLWYLVYLEIKEAFIKTRGVKGSN
jgi:hypothetical protein